MRRGFVPGAVLVTTPKLALFVEQQVVFGGANWVRLNRLKNSTRNSTLARPSRSSRRFLKAATSTLSTPSERRVESTRGSLPKVKSAGATKHPVLNQPLRRGLPPVARQLLHAVRQFGRQLEPNTGGGLRCPSWET